MSVVAPSGPPARLVVTIPNAGESLVRSLQRGEDQDVINFCVNTDPQSIPPDGSGGMSHIFFVAVSCLNLVALEWIQHHPNLSDIPACGEWSLSNALVHLVAALHRLPEAEDNWEDLIEAVVAQPNAKDIQLNPVEAQLLKKLLFKLALSQKMRSKHHAHNSFVALLSSLTHVHTPDGPVGLGRLLFHSVQVADLRIIDAILRHRDAAKISSVPTKIVPDLDDLTYPQLGDTRAINQFGFSEALFAAIQCKRLDVVQRLFTFVSRKGLQFKVNEDFGLADSLTSAAEYLPEAVPLILYHPSSILIEVNAPQHGFYAALHNAAEDNHLEAVEALLEHPKAREIDRDKLEGIRDRAVIRDYREIVAVLTNFLREAG
jgi:hypothetical protein